MRTASFLGSSRKNRELRILAHGGAVCRKGLWRSKKMQHNMGLCCMDGQGEGVGSITFFILPGRLGRRLEKSERV